MGKSLLLLPIGVADYGIVIPQNETLTFPLEFHFRNLDGLYPEGSPLFPGDLVLEIPAVEPSFPLGPGSLGDTGGSYTITVPRGRGSGKL